MFDAASLKLFGAIILFCGVQWTVAAGLVGRQVAGRVLTKGTAQFIGALLGLAFGVVFLLAVG